MVKSYIFHAGKGKYEVRYKEKNKHFGLITKGIGIFYPKKDAIKLMKKLNRRL